MPAAKNNGRVNQRHRTRKDLLQAAARLMQQGRKPSLEEIAGEALVSRATAYRYFPGLDALLLEASVDMHVPDPGELFRDDASTDPVERVQRADIVLHEVLLANEAALRMAIAASLERIARGDTDVPARQNRRTPLIDAALKPARKQFAPGQLDTLRRALALVLGTEAMIVFKDVLQVDDKEARRVKRWVIEALVEAARRKP